MFHHYAENSSTGEPPTPPSDNAAEPNYRASSISHQAGSELSRSSGSSRSLLVQESDSGYEASPSSIADNASSCHFFGEQPMPNTPSDLGSSRHMGAEEPELQDYHSLFLFSESDSDLDEWDTCPECNSSSCDCFRTDSSTTNITTAVSNCDNRSSSNCSEMSSNRPSSQPIQIPAFQQGRIVPRSFVVDPHLDLRLQPARSQPIDISRLQSLRFFVQSHPVSWPSRAQWYTERSAVATPFSPRNLWRDIPYRPRRTLRPVRSRRQIIDSEASSLDSSDEDGPEDVFNMAADETMAFDLCMVTDGGEPLPDVVLQSADNSNRRNRSVSVNLPPEPELLQSIGRALRRLSDQFHESRLRNHTRRRQTICSIRQLNGKS